MIRIWFSRWFSSIYRVIDDFKKESTNLNFYIIGTNPNINAVYKNICDEWYEELDTLNSGEYVEWALKFCKEHNINIFVPRKHMVEISLRKNEFTKIGTKVLVECDYNLVKILSNKKSTMEYFAKNKICTISDYEIVSNPKEFQEKYNELKKRNPNEKICMKFIEGEGGSSFRIIEENLEGILSLEEETNDKINYNLLLKMINISKNYNPIILMILLNGTEISIDCLQLENKLIAIPRYKTGGRKQKIKFDNQIINIVEKFNNIAKLQCPFNIQFKYHNDRLYLLEVNTRMSGGLYLSNKSGYNIMYNAICKLLNLPTIIPNNLKEIDVGYIEEGIVLV